LTFKGKRNIHRKRIFDYENGDKLIANPENHFRIEHFNIKANEMKSNQINSKTWYESFAKSVDKFGSVFKVSNLKINVKMLKHC
jgi:hypothetical protein